MLISLTTKTVALTFKSLFLPSEKSDRTGNPAWTEKSSEIPQTMQAKFYIIWALYYCYWKSNWFQ